MNLRLRFPVFLSGMNMTDAESALFEIVRAAFLAGWRAAGGECPSAERIFQVLGGTEKNSGNQ